VKASLKYLFALAVSIYLLSNIGIPVYYHYCCGELESINALINQSECCGEDEEENSDCCQNETKIIAQKSETSFQTLQYKIAPESLQLFVITHKLLFDYSTLKGVKPVLANLSDHPPESGRQMLITKSVLLI
jgi:hypothetical protein